MSALRLILATEAVEMLEAGTLRWWESKLIGRLHLLGALAVLPLLLRLAVEEDLTWLAGVLVAALVGLLTVVRWPYGALSVIVGMSAMPVYYVEISGWKARPEHFAAFIVLVAVCVSLIFSKRKVQLHTLDYCILGFVAVNFVSSAVGSSAPASTLRWALQNTLAIVPYFLIRVLVVNLDILRKAFRILLVVSAAEAVFGILCFVSYHLFGTTVGMNAGQYLIDVAAPYGSMFEANLFGTYCACAAILFLAMYLSGRHRVAAGLGMMVTVFATVISYSRASLLALILVSFWVFWRMRHSAGSVRWKMTAPVLAVTVALVLAFTAAGGVLQQRFANLYYEGLTEQTAIARVFVIQEAALEIPAHPLLGSGTASFNLSFDWSRYIPEWASDATWIANTPLRILHDTGVIGLSFFLAFFVLVWKKIHATLKVSANPDGMVLGLSAGTLLYAVVFQFGDGTILAFSWVHLGFLATAAIIFEKSYVAPSEPIEKRA